MHFGLHNSINQPRSRNTKRDENVLLIQGKNSVVLIDMSKKEDVSELTFLEVNYKKAFFFFFKRIF